MSLRSVIRATGLIATGASVKVTTAGRDGGGQRHAATATMSAGTRVLLRASSRRRDRQPSERHRRLIRTGGGPRVAHLIRKCGMAMPADGVSVEAVISGSDDHTAVPINVDIA